MATEITEIKKSIKEIKVDIVKNQELIISLTDRANYSGYSTKGEGALVWIKFKSSSFKH